MGLFGFIKDQVSSGIKQITGAREGILDSVIDGATGIIPGGGLVQTARDGVGAITRGSSRRTTSGSSGTPGGAAGSVDGWQTGAIPTYAPGVGSGFNPTPQPVTSPFAGGGSVNIPGVGSGSAYFGEPQRQDTLQQLMPVILGGLGLLVVMQMNK